MVSCITVSACKWWPPGPLSNLRLSNETAWYPKISRGSAFVRAQIIPHVTLRVVDWFTAAPVLQRWCRDPEKMIDTRFWYNWCFIFEPDGFEILLRERWLLGGWKEFSLFFSERSSFLNRWNNYSLCLLSKL